MSWFRRRPVAKEPPRHLPHRRRSPMLEKLIEEKNEKQFPVSEIVSHNLPDKIKERN